jgi:hypothetical protein
MKLSMVTIALSVLSIPCFAACASSYPAPTQRMADAMSAERSAKELGAASNPRARLHLSLAEEELTRAKALVESGDNRRAEFVLVRAKGDAELAVALMRETSAETEAQQALDAATALRTRYTQDVQRAHDLFPGAHQ